MTEITKANKGLKARRFKVNSLIGKGTWGEVYSVTDRVTGEQLAAKVLCPTKDAEAQIKALGIDPIKALVQEGTFTASNYVVPRRIEIDDSGKPFVIMPLYPESLASKIDRPERLFVGNGLSQDRAIMYLGDIAKGLNELHTKYRRTHRDLKPENLLLDREERVHISDLGTATFTSFSKWGSFKDNRGFIYTRAPERFEDENDEHAMPSSDVWAWASLASRLFRGKYLLEEEIDNTIDPREFFKQIGEEGTNRIVQKKFNDERVPKRLRKFLSACGNFCAHKRPRDGASLEFCFHEEVENIDWKKVLKNSFAKFAAPIGIPALVFALAGYGAYVHEPRALDIPETQTKGLLYPTGAPDEQRIAFEAEDLPDLKKIEICDGYLFHTQESIAKRTTHNRNIAYLLKSHGQTQTQRGGLHGVYTDFQFQTYMHSKNLNGGAGALIDHPPWDIWAKSIEVGMQHAKTKEGNCDLEDTMAIARVGPAKVLEAKRVSGSEDYGVYRDAANSKGERIIPVNERDFIDTWLAYYHRDL